MSTDIRLAFDSLQARASASAGDEPLDRIMLRDHVVRVEIGAFQAERGKTQRVRFNVVVEVRPQPAALRDDVDRILSYDTITRAIALELAEQRLNLLETLAQNIAGRILSAPQARRVFVRIEKLDRGPGALGVEIVRDSAPADGAPATSEARHSARPLVVYLANPAIHSPRLTGWIDQLQASGKPVILCVGAAAPQTVPQTVPQSASQTAPQSVPQSAAGLAQRRIDLLAIEQNAWVLAGRDPRCVVMHSRTELIWAADNAKISVWAPSKMVLDALDGPPGLHADPLALVTWFTTRINATALITVGARAPGGLDIPVTQISPDQPTLL